MRSSLTIEAYLSMQIKVATFLTKCTFVNWDHTSHYKFVWYNTSIKRHSDIGPLNNLINFLGILYGPLALFDFRLEIIP